MLTMFLEGSKGTPVSMRRVLAFILSVSGIALSWYSTSSNNLFGVYGGVACFIFAFLLLVCTTAADIVALVQAAKGLGK
jgi:apolipoprotein N-acyltransferase